MARSTLILVLFFVLLGLLSTSWARLQDEKPSSKGRERSPREREMERREREHGHGQRREEESADQYQINLGEPQDLLQCDGGRLRVWSERIDAIRNSHVGIAELELEQDGLLVPQYADSPKIAYVLQGSGRMGAVTPGAQSDFRRTYVRRVSKDDVIALPKGTVYWWYNDGNERHRVLCSGDTTYGANPGRFHQFGLAGSKQSRFGSVLHGFSHESLATAWGVDQKTIQSLLDRQSDAGIVKAKQKIRFPEVPERRREEEERDTNLDGMARSFYFEELKYSVKSAHPDIYVKNGGLLNIVNSHKLPALRQVGFSAIKGALEKNAMAAPLFVRNAHQLIYITRGNGRVQVASGDGQKVFDEDVREGTVLVIPQFFPSLKIAGDQGLEWITLLTSDGPSASFLAGKNSVYRGIPEQVIAAAFNVEAGKLKELGRDEEVIFPARRGGRGGREDNTLIEGEKEQQRGGSEREREEQQRRRREQEEEQRRRQQEEQKRREEEEQRRKREREREEQQRREREREEQQRREREKEEQRREREREEEERKKQQRELPSWALASLQLI